MNDILTDFFKNNGPICSTGKVNDIFRNMEKKGEIKVIRETSTTPTGRPSKFFVDEKGKLTKLRWHS